MPGSSEPGAAVVCVQGAHSLTADQFVGWRSGLASPAPAGTWFGLLAPAATPKTVVTRLNSELVKIIQSADFKRQMLDISAEPVGNKPEEMARQIREETEKFAQLVKLGKVTID